MGRFRSIWRQWAGTAWYATITTVLAAVAGLFGSVYSTEIGRSFPLFLGPYNAVSKNAIAFWITLILFAVLFFQRQRHDDAARMRLENTSAAIQELVATLPPNGEATKAPEGEATRNERA
jgi:amino acid permease